MIYFIKSLLSSIVELLPPSIVDFLFSKKKLQIEQNHKKNFYNFEAKQKPYNELLTYLSKLDEIGKLKSSKDCILSKENIVFFHNIIEEFRTNFENWKINSGGYRLLEEAALESYHMLGNALGKGTSNNGMFGNRDQLLKIWGRKNKLYQHIVDELK